LSFSEIGKSLTRGTHLSAADPHAEAHLSEPSLHLAPRAAPRSTGRGSAHHECARAIKAVPWSGWAGPKLPRQPRSEPRPPRRHSPPRSRCRCRLAATRVSRYAATSSCQVGRYSPALLLLRRSPPCHSSHRCHRHWPSHALLLLHRSPPHHRACERPGSITIPTNMAYKPSLLGERLRLLKRSVLNSKLPKQIISSGANSTSVGLLPLATKVSFSE
jgi:hypothetical protein